LISNNSGEAQNQSGLLDSICKSQTPMGSTFQFIFKVNTVNLGRLLRTSILQPLTDLIEINERQEAIQLLLEKESELQLLRDALQKIPDVDKFISKLIRKENFLDPKSGDELIHNTLQLKSIFSSLRVIERVIKENFMNSPCIAFLTEIIQNSRLSAIEICISDLINEDISYCNVKSNLHHHQRLQAVKSTNNSLLEVSRRTLKETQSDIYEYVEDWTAQIDLVMDIKYQTKRGYYLSVSKAALGDRSI
jgi:DNA mismatch repair protein MSH4